VCKRRELGVHAQALCGKGQGKSWRNQVGKGDSIGAEAGSTRSTFSPRLHLRADLRSPRVASASRRHLRATVLPFANGADISRANYAALHHQRGAGCRVASFEHTLGRDWGGSRVDLRPASSTAAALFKHGIVGDDDCEPVSYDRHIALQRGPNHFMSWLVPPGFWYPDVWTMRLGYETTSDTTFV